MIGKYISQHETTMKNNGFTGNLWTIHSNGGMICVDQAVNHSGVAATCFITKNMEITNAVTMDMGGTSCDIAMIENNEPVTATDREIAFDVPISIPMIDVTAIGTGGGGMAWVDRQGILKVEPESAGADPGPAFYGRKAGCFTISDANLLLGYIHPKAFMVGEMMVDKEGTHEFALMLGKKMNTDDVIKIAKGILIVANNNMAHALSDTLIKKGRDPREFTLIAYGGAGTLHATATARIL